MSDLLSPTFHIGHIHIGTVEGASCVNLGNNWPTDFENYKKHTQGFGEVGGDHNKLTEAQSTVADSELIDMLNLSDDAEIPDWLKELMENASRTSMGDHR